MTLSNPFMRTTASLIALSLTITPAMAKSADDMQDLVGARAGQAEGTLTARGWTYADGDKSGSEAHAYWWNASRKDCIKVTTRDGRYAAIEDASDKDCGKKSGSGGAVAAAAVVGAVALGALLLTRKDKDKNKNDSDYDYEQGWQQVEAYNLQSGTLRIFAGPSTNEYVRGRVSEGTRLRNMGCDEYSGESWCEVQTMNGRTTGWARDKYLRVTDYGSGGGWGGGGGGWGNNNQMVEVYNLQSGRLKITSGPSKNDYVVGSVREGATLRKSGCQSAEGEQWCHVATPDRRLNGGARERYLRPASGYPGSGGGWGGGGNWGGNRDLVEVYNLQTGTLNITSGPSKSDYVVGRVGSGTTLRRQGCETAEGESWCRVTTMDGRISGWARERYLRGN
ncbi:MAG: hypothetical protein KDE55_06265 [Novosphingobium sp.]|nr:hypothetical protein [Novosphingobium sp.]